jgi:hypothetical protein
LRGKNQIARQSVLDANIFASSSVATREAYGQVCCNFIYPERTDDSIFSRFKDTSHLSSRHEVP